MRPIYDLLTLVLLISALTACAHKPTGPTAGPTVVLVHGAWGGGWDLKGVEQVLRQRGAVVYRPTLTGLGERRHLASPEIDLTTHVTDIVNVLEWERLENVVLVGHSYGGMVITGVAERVPQRIGRLVYLDAFLPLDGECVLSTPLGGAKCSLKDPNVIPFAELSKGFFTIRGTEQPAAPPADVPHPARAFSERIRLASAPGNGRPALYVITREELGGPDDFDWAAARARTLGWPLREVLGDHVVYRTKPAEIVDVLLELTR